MLTAQLPDRSRDGTGGDRATRGTRPGTCSTNVPLGQSVSGQRQVRWRHSTRTATTPGTSCKMRRHRPRLGVTIPQVGQPTSCQGLEMATVSRSASRWTVSTWTPSRPSNTSQREQGSVVGAATHPVASSRSSGVNSCLDATDHRRPRPLSSRDHTASLTPHQISEVRRTRVGGCVSWSPGPGLVRDVSTTSRMGGRRHRVLWDQAGDEPDVDDHAHEFHECLGDDHDRGQVERVGQCQR